MRKERPILFSTEMVEAILDDRKTMTRRKVKADISDCYFQSLVLHAYGIYTWVKNGNYAPEENDVINVICPYGQIGDMLWVRETYAQAMGDYAYKADYSNETIKDPINKGLWHPSIFMPKAAARIWLEITGIKVERLHQITDEDACKEGYGKGTEFHATDWFEQVWKGINGDESWNANPWVWAISFKVLSTTGRPEFL